MGETLFFDPDPVEVDHHYTYLAEIAGQAIVTETSQSDMRSRRFSPLTALQADQIEWSNHHHTDVDTNTVQGAIDLLWGRDSGDECICTFCIVPDQNLTQQLSEIFAKLAVLGAELPTEKMNSAVICFPRGVFFLEGPVNASGLDHITLRGAGREATEIVQKSGATLSIEKCAALTVEDLSMTIPEDAASVQLAVTAIQSTTLSRCLFSGPTGAKADEEPIALVSIDGQSGSVDASVWVKECIFGVLEHRLGLRISTDGLQVVRDCQFIGTPQATRGKFGGIISKYLDGTNVVAKAPGVDLGPKSGLYQVTGVDDRVYDVSHVPMSDRDALIRYVIDAQVIAGVDAPRNAEEWKLVAAGIEGITFKALAAPIADGTLGPATDLGGGRAENPFAITRDTVEPVAIGRDTGGPIIGNPVGARRALAGRGSFGGFTTDMISADELENIRLSEHDIKQVHEALGDFVLTAQVASFHRNFGVLIVPAAHSRTQISGNQFKWVHSAIVVIGSHPTKRSGVLTGTSSVTVTRNSIQRTPIKGSSQAKAKGGLYPAAITLRNVGRCDVSYNSVQQLVTTAAQFNNYIIGYLNAKTMAVTDEGFSAIEMRGAIGPVTQAIGNEALYFRHAVFANGEPQWQGSPSQNPNLRENFWTFRRNCVLPATEVSTGVSFSGALFGTALMDHMRIIPFNSADDNHPPHPFNNQ
ncbi:hypothetical protein RC74_12145 [Falsihalocynthiibacter arcticus]|uniref:Uncharacterized protein n=1 Tax=Falsihalocynthiibacter arcticus TaxID=1579316 RepID=A0A126V202_9RHOB|nr:hypothetical protein RC74_12145 [Falsihalocynthiibacter arcticus]